ncbi:MAG: hypothetical protein RIQ56_996 [Candidatus Parcubacteria bacterium]
MGYRTKTLSRTAHSRGKRFRPALALLLAKAYGAEKKVFDAALAIELFHNFSLIHDDIADKDELRRGNPTLWKLWGINHALNAGDAQIFLSNQFVLSAARIPKVGQTLSVALSESFLQVCEGQYLDFELGDTHIEEIRHPKEQYLEMARKKTGALIGVSAQVAGFAAGKSRKECEVLRRFGESLGVAYQIADDYRSIWGKDTGKDMYGDIRERKRSLPLLFAVNDSNARTSYRLRDVLNLNRRLADLEVIEVLGLVDATHAKVRTLESLKLHAAEAARLISLLSVSLTTKKKLLGLLNTLIPEALSDT